MRYLRIKSLCSNKDNWIDRDVILLHASFQILTDYIELEKGDIYCNYETHKASVDELRFLYNWWKKRLLVEIRTTNEKAQYKEDNEMLIRLINIRGFLWT